MPDLSSEQIHEAFDRALKKVAARYAAGELDISGRYYSDAELAEMPVGPVKKPEAAVKPDAAA